MEKILAILSKLVLDVDFEVEENLVEDGLIDSIDIVSMIVELNAAYGITIPSQEIDESNFESAKTIKAMVDRVLAQSSPTQNVEGSD